MGLFSKFRESYEESVLGSVMEDPFSQSDHAVVVVVEHHVKASAPEEERKTMVQTVRESLAQSAHVVRDAVLSHTTTTTAAGADHGCAATPIEDAAPPEEEEEPSRGIIAAVGDIMAHPVQTMKDIIGSHSSDVVAPGEQATVDGQEEEVKGLMQTVKEAALEVKEEMLEVVQEVKDVVMSTDTLPNVQTESITEDAGERPSMELVHTIVHD